ncbi:fumarylacetoacetate hydrolase family protein [Rhizorhabdus dicambivorans]|uniref:FAA hydrolase family protein n=1 Tax=Rhizorhabdus dicambivorans TaxID=1850238 RepID=A0A2A4FVT7_9SPHN|nr:fumarylacetoacetate hydrolase family protein [Rhizorhabdus dicambivorans]ATE65496.1 FAA hydrolase family protein [Rhizorhabdus dicambivorans]PCE41840.1 FAA hydrolase family protein [Rhizorhabdus dicambivorans]
MKLASYRAGGRDSFGLVRDDGIVDLGSRLDGIADLKALLERGLDTLDRGLLEAPADHRPDDVIFLPVIPNPGAIYCVGLNTQSHFDEVGETLGLFPVKPQRPWLFMRTARAQVGHGVPLEKPNGTPLFDYEGEIAIVIGSYGRFVPEDQALGHVAGYACFNDGSLRDFQMHSPLFTAGKNFPRSGAFGPWLVTPDEAGPPEALHLTTRVNGRIVQDMPYGDLLFTFPQLISYISQFTELLPGDVIVTGSGEGVGILRQPPLLLQHGDVCEISVTGVGTLSNPVADAEGHHRAPESRTDVEAAIVASYGRKPGARSAPTATDA